MTMRDVAIVGVGMQKWGELWEKSFRDLFVEAALNAISDTKIPKIDHMYIGCMTGGLFVGQEHVGSIMADYLGQRNLAATRVESACASGGMALRCGFVEVASGMSDIVLVGGVEKMTDVSGDGATYALATAADQEYEVFHGATFPGLYALMARAYMERYGATRDQLSAVAVKNHDNGLNNPNAQYQMKLTVQQVNESVMVADPLRILDCSPITDGAAALILCPLNRAKEFSDKPPIKIIGCGMATDSIALHDRRDLTSLDAVRISAEQALKMAGKKIGDINVTEVHDCFTIAEIIVSEALGMFPAGKGALACVNGETRIEGRFPINASGGLKSKGHPVGATGVAQAIEIVHQLRGEAGKRQVKNAKIGMTQNMGGSGGSSVVHIMEVA
jgi:acetyl-CoA C-acetyltransferase